MKKHQKSTEPENAFLSPSFRWATSKLHRFSHKTAAFYTEQCTKPLARNLIITQGHMKYGQYASMKTKWREPALSRIHC